VRRVVGEGQHVGGRPPPIDDGGHGHSVPSGGSEGQGGMPHDGRVPRGPRHRFSAANSTVALTRTECDRSAPTHPRTASLP
jgi:hypothetical protein